MSVRYPQQKSQETVQTNGVQCRQSYTGENLDAIKAENCNISQRSQFPFKEDKITVIANGCAIRPDPKSVIVRERSRGFDGG